MNEPLLRRTGMNRCDGTLRHDFFTSILVPMCVSLFLQSTRSLSLSLFLSFCLYFLSFSLSFSLSLLLARRPFFCTDVSRMSSLASNRANSLGPQSGPNL